MSSKLSSKPAVAAADVHAALCAVSPLDGRYQRKTEMLRDYTSEFALIRYRVKVEVEWLLFLAELDAFDALPKLSQAAHTYIKKCATDFTVQQAAAVKQLESVTQHDVKAVEYWLRQQCSEQAPAALQTELSACIPFLHFACTSEDINNCAYALMQRDLSCEVLTPQWQHILDALNNMAKTYANTPMLARTHGQAASPTTFGKEIKVFSARLQSCQDALAQNRYSAKFNGAVGNYHAHLAAYPDLNWPHLCYDFLKKLDLHHNPHTTQIEPHDHLCAWLQTLMRANNILLDCCRDFWGYISLGYLQQRLSQDEVGSSTMPHKINPIDFENCEGNLGLSNSLAEFFIRKLPVSRWQRDLSDSTCLRNLGSCIGYANISYQSLLRGLEKISVNEAHMREELKQHWEVLTEAVQSMMRRHGIDDAYEQLKKFSRGQAINKQQLHAFIEQTSLPATAKQQLLALAPENYLGNAAQQAATDITVK